MFHKLYSLFTHFLPLNGAQRYCFFLKHANIFTKNCVFFAKMIFLAKKIVKLSHWCPIKIKEKTLLSTKKEQKHKKHFQIKSSRFIKCHFIIRAIIAGAIISVQRQ